MKGNCWLGAQCPNSHPFPEVGSDLFSVLRLQIEFYFTKKNWDANVFLQRTFIEQAGAIPVEIVLGFARIQSILAAFPVKTHRELVLISLVDSEVIAITPDGLYFAPRPIAGPPMFIA